MAQALELNPGQVSAAGDRSLSGWLASLESITEEAGGRGVVLSQGGMLFTSLFPNVQPPTGLGTFPLRKFIFVDFHTKGRNIGIYFCRCK